MQGSEIVVRMLEKYGVKHLFGLPGDTGITLYDSLSRAKGLSHILCRDERHVGYMADAYARVSDKPGVCEVPSGGGVTYVLPAVAEADGSSVPMVCLSSDVPFSSDEKSALTAIDQKTLFTPITRFSHRIVSPDAIPFMMRKAFRMATSGSTGPAHLALPENVLSGQIDARAVEHDIYAEEVCQNYPSLRSRPDSLWVDQAAKLLIAAQRPVIIAGGGVLLSRAWEEARQLAEHLSIPVVTTINGKGSIAEVLPLAMGVMGTNGAKLSTNQVISEADVILAIGTRLNSSITMSPSLISKEAKIIQIDVNPAQLGNNFRIEVPLPGDARLALQDLMTAILERHPAPLPMSDWVLACRARVDEEFAALEKSLAGAAGAGPMHPARVVKVLEKLLPLDSVLVSDAGYSTPYLSAYYRIKKAGRCFVDPRAHGSLGYALPAAIGAKLARPQSTVVGLFGDGSLGMSIGELETVTRLKLPIIYLHFNNNCFGWIQNLQKIYCDNNYFSTSFDPSVDYVKIAAAYGLNGLRADSEESLAEALKTGLTSERATFIEIMIPSGAELTPLVIPWLRDECIPAEERNRKSY